VTVAITTEGAVARLTWWDVTAGIALPILSAAAQVLVLHEDIVGPWLS